MTPIRPMSSFTLSDPASYRAAALEADLIMKGGITSGLVYPLAASRLATRYSFRSVGGASAGAIAAGFTAAAEYQRRHPSTGDAAGPGAGFAALTTIPDVLGTKLATLFVPSAKLRHAYETLTTWIEPDFTTGRKLRTTLLRLATGVPVAFWLVLIGLLAPGVWVAVTLLQGRADGLGIAAAVVLLVVWLAVAMAAAWTTAAVTLGRRALNLLPENGFGFCNGMPAEDRPKADPPLTVWLADWLDQVAGLPPGAGPLTFGHLYGEAASAAFRELRLDESVAPASPLERRRFAPELDLQMMTTCLTFQRPYVFPFRTKVFHYCPDCWRRYFPERVVVALVAASTTPEPKTQKVEGRDVPIDQTCRHHRGTSVLVLPPAPDIPVVVGVRMSLSFPILLSAIPFQTIDYNRADGKRSLVEVWFSDGGISSNFPIHFFDSLLPRRPTFGINLADQHPDFPEQLVFRPGSNRSGILPRAKSITSVVGFLGAVVNTMHNWVDNMAVPAPGFRDRVVDLRTKAGEGGLNLKMKPETIRLLGERGDRAAQLLEDFDFDAHRWIRYRTSMPALTETLDAMAVAYPGYHNFLADHEGRSYRFDSKTARARDRAGTEALITTVTEWAHQGYPATDGNLPDPRPQLRPLLRQ